MAGAEEPPRLPEYRVALANIGSRRREKKGPYLSIGPFSQRPAGESGTQSVSPRGKAERNWIVAGCYAARAFSTTSVQAWTRPCSGFNASFVVENRISLSFVISLT